MDPNMEVGATEVGVMAAGLLIAVVLEVAAEIRCVTSQRPYGPSQESPARRRGARAVSFPPMLIGGEGDHARSSRTVKHLTWMPGAAAAGVKHAAPMKNTPRGYHGVFDRLSRPTTGTTLARVVLVGTCQGDLAGTCRLMVSDVPHTYTQPLVYFYTDCTVESPAQKNTEGF